MRRTYGSLFVLAAIVLVPGTGAAQDTETSKAVAGGGVKAAGWMGKVDPKEATAGMTVANALFEKAGNDFHVITGPATTYWNPGNKATGNYTVSATFKEPKFRGLNDHPHPYGIVIAGNDLGTDANNFLYCAAYGDGRFIMRGFGPTPFNLNGRGEANAAIHKVAVGEPVSQDIAVSVTADKVQCSINGTVVGSYDKAAVTGEGKVKSTDGMYGIRFAHNTEGTVSNFKMTKN